MAMVVAMFTLTTFGQESLPESFSNQHEGKVHRTNLSSVYDLAGDVIIINEEFEYHEYFTAATPARHAVAGEIKVLDAKKNMIAIYGIDKNALGQNTHITGTVNLTTGTITIPERQLVWNHPDAGAVVMANALGTGDFTANIYEDGSIIFNNLWYECYNENKRNGSYKGTSFLEPNGNMTYVNEKGTTTNVPVYVTQDSDKAFVHNFGNFGVVAELILGINSFKIDNKVVVEKNSKGSFGVYGMDSSKSVTIARGTVSGSSLTCSSDWTLYSSAEDLYYGRMKPFTISLIGGNIFNNTTGINEIRLQEKDDNVWYILQGVAVDKPTRGIYIRNGKKVIVK